MESLQFSEILGKDFIESVQNIIQQPINGHDPVAFIEKVKSTISGFTAKIIEHKLQNTLGTGYCGSYKTNESGTRLDFVEHTHKNFVTSAGIITLKRSYYYGAGESDFPIETEYPFLKDSFFPDVKAMVCLACSCEPYQMACTMLRKIGNINISPASAERITKEVGGILVKKEDNDVKAAMSGQVKKREDTVREIMGISMDGCCIRTIDEWREAKNGVVFDVCHDEDGKPHASAKSYISRIENSEEFGKRLYTEAKQRNSEAAKKIIVVGDGARWIWEEATLHFPESVQIVDWYHAKEHLWKAAELIFGSREKEEAKEWIKKTRNILFSGEVESLAEEMAKECKRQNKKITDGLETEQNYFVKNKDRMQYSRFEKLGYPTGSGTVESACKNLVQIRMKRCGMKWTEEGAHAVLKLRCMLLSDRWNEVEGNCLDAA